MSFKKLVMTLLVGGSMAASAQEFRSDVAVQATGSFVRETENNGLVQSATHSGGVLGTYRWYFNRNNGVEFDYGYSLNTQKYQFGGTSAGIRTHVNEATAAYVLRFPMRRVTPFALAGAGALVFAPQNIGDAQARAAFVYGAGVDWNLSDRVFLRAQYRGQVYNAPELGPAIVSGSERITHRAQPSVGFGFRF